LRVGWELDELFNFLWNSLTSFSGFFKLIVTLGILWWLLNIIKTLKFPSVTKTLKYEFRHLFVYKKSTGNNHQYIYFTTVWEALPLLVWIIYNNKSYNHIPIYCCYKSFFYFICYLWTLTLPTSYLWHQRGLSHILDNAVMDVEGAKLHSILIFHIFTLKERRQV